MTKVPRNAPCPCGSGRKYKQCCARTDEAGAATRRSGTESAPARHPLAGTAPVDEWQAEIIPLPIDVETSPHARPTALLVTAGGFVLHNEILTGSLAEPEEIAAKLAAAVETAAAGMGRLPRAVAVRWPEVAAALQDQLGGRTTVRCRSFLEDLEGPARSMLVKVADYPYWPSVSRPASWLAWGLPRSVIAELFDAAAAYHRAAPWRRLDGDPPLEVVFPGERRWTVSVMGSGGEEFGLAMYERFPDYLAAVTNEDIPAGLAALVGRVVGVAFTPGSDLPPAMPREVAIHRWRIASARAYPLIVPLNTPAGGLSRADAADLIALLRVVPDFIEAHADALAALAHGGDGSLDVCSWVHEPTGAIVAYDARGTAEAAPAFVADACARIDGYAKRDRMATPAITDGAKRLLREYARISPDELSRAMKPEVWAAGALLATSRRHQPGARTASSFARVFDVSRAAVYVRARRLEQAVGFLLDEDQDMGQAERTPYASLDATLSLWPDEEVPSDDTPTTRSAPQPEPGATPTDDVVVLPFRRRESANAAQNASPFDQRSADAAASDVNRRQLMPRVPATVPPTELAVGDAPAFTQVQGQYLTFIHYYTKVHRAAPSERDMQAFFRVSPPSVHNMVKTLEKKGLIARVPGQARTVRVLVPREVLPELD